MRRIDWADAVRVLALLVTAFFVAAAVLQAMLAFNVLGAPPAEKPAFIDKIFDSFRWEHDRWPVEGAATVLFALGFVAFAGLGMLLARLADQADARRALATGSFAAAGVIGVVSQLFWLGVKPIATNPEYCECGFRQEEIMSRLMILGVAGPIQTWMVMGAIILSSIGVVLVARLARSAGMPQAWVWLSYAIAVLSLVASVLGALGLYPFDQLAILIVAAILVPVWALWLAIRALNLAGPVILLPGG
jgi:hypothetical protein